MNQFLFKSLTDNVLIHAYLNDLLASFLLLAYSNTVIALTGRDEYRITCISRILLFSFAVGLFWEYVSPVYTASFSDSIDLAAYAAGGLLYFLALRAAFFSRDRSEKECKSNAC